MTVAVAWFTGYYDGGLLSSYGITTNLAANAAVGGFAGSYVGSGWNFQAGLQGAITAAAFSGVGDLKLDGFQNVAAHAAVGCATSAMSGGSCGSGALAAGAGELGAQHMPDVFRSNKAYGLVYVTVVGGTTSVLGGGKFANGAQTAAFGYLFNCLQHQCLEQRRADAVASEVSERGYFKGKGEADWIYQTNSDSSLSVVVDASKLSVTVMGDWVADPNGGLRAAGRVTGDDYWVHGQITVRARPDGTFGIYDQRYDYEMHADFSLKGIARNIGTFLGSPPAGMPNTSYWIRYRGNTTITNP